jgi:hypothetical protein
VQHDFSELFSVEIEDSTDILLLFFILYQPPIYYIRYVYDFVKEVRELLTYHMIAGLWRTGKEVKKSMTYTGWLVFPVLRKIDHMAVDHIFHVHDLAPVCVMLLDVLNSMTNVWFSLLF